MAKKKNEKKEKEKDADADVAAPETGEAADGAEPERKRRRFSGKQLVLFGALPALLLLGGGGGLMFSGVLGGGEDGDAAHEQAEAAPGHAVFLDLPEMIVNLNGDGQQTGFLKIHVALELGDEEAAAGIEQLLPRIIDNFQVYLRELRPEELKGTRGVFRLKEELLVRVKAAAQPFQVNDILFKEILVQG